MDYPPSEASTRKGERFMAKLTLREIREIRRLILEGFPAKTLAEAYRVSESTIRAYTKAERAKVG